MKIIDLVQGSPEWLKWRRNRITATCASTIMDLNPFKLTIELWEEMLGMRPPPKQNSKMKRGQELEPIARELLISETGINFIPICGEHDTQWWMAASFDGFSQEKNIICEIKCPKIQTHIEVIETRQIPFYYYAQCQHQIFVSGASKALYTSYYPKHSKELDIIEIMPDAEFIEELCKRSKFFFETNLCQMTRPSTNLFTLKT